MYLIIIMHATSGHGINLIRFGVWCGSISVSLVIYAAYLSLFCNFHVGYLFIPHASLLVFVISRCCRHCYIYPASRSISILGVLAGLIKFTVSKQRRRFPDSLHT